MNDIFYKGFRKDEMEYQYNPRESVPEYPELARVRAAQAKKVRDSAKSWRNIAYGNSPREQLDIYAADRPNGAVLIYIHGGYWRSGSKEDNCKSSIARIVEKVQPSDALRSESKSVPAITLSW